ncbi:hypothetical protein AMJ44_02115 [candidate division WOR-1 bacterium DG_54_3]|uniref:DUF2065 domain-containing protein n=1 Tax=candidate division WOR-1 bacterium DG_54_3 TaxID=1703775 RepID=A0A0S7Y5C9_UNCSA|nr:MAG: hypothetical protein AMJ44_02115 [candidate division WOR-1 bacterium DG_54_3]
MGWLITIGVFSLVFGMILLFPAGAVRMLDAFLNKPLVYLDQKLRSVRLLSGIALVIIGGWIIWVAANYKELWFLNIIGIILIFFGLLYLFLPGWLDQISVVMDKTLLSPDEIVISIRRSLGIIFIIIAIYIFYSAYLMAG